MTGRVIPPFDHRVLPVRIEASDIADGKPGEASECALALALSRLSGGRPAKCFPEGAVIEYPEHEHRYRYKARVRQFIERFDARKPVSPDDFYLRDAGEHPKPRDGEERIWRRAPWQ